MGIWKSCIFPLLTLKTLKNGFHLSDNTTGQIRFVGLEFDTCDLKANVTLLGCCVVPVR